jgi:hypothetical protein
MLTAVYFRTAMAAAPTASRWGLIDAYLKLLWTSCLSRIFYDTQKIWD